MPDFVPGEAPECVRAIVALSDQGRAYVDAYARTMEIATIFFDEEPLSFAGAAEDRSAPTSSRCRPRTPRLRPARSGHFDDGRTRVIAALLADGTRKFARMDGDVYSSNVPALYGDWDRSRSSARARWTRMRLYDYAASGNCFKVRLLLGMLGVEYERVPIDIFGGDTLTCEYAMINPLRETPVLELDGGERLGQSNAILWYLGEGTKFLPQGRLERGQVAQWLSFEQERVMGGLGGPRFRLLTGRATPEELEPRLATGRGALEVLDAHLTARDWLVGDAPSIADLGLFPYVSVSPVEIPACGGRVAGPRARAAGVRGRLRHLPGERASRGGILDLLACRVCRTHRRSMSGPADARPSRAG